MLEFLARSRLGASSRLERAVHCLQVAHSAPHNLSSPVCACSA